MISEVSCDTEDWSNDAEYSALRSQKKSVIMFHSIIIHCTFVTNRLGEHMKNVFKNIFKNLTDPKPFKQSSSAAMDKRFTRDAPILNFSADTDSRLFRMISADTDDDSYVRVKI